MAWKYNSNKTLPVVKADGKCMRKSMWRYCPYWVAKHTSKRRVIGYRCSLFEVDKSDDTALPECNERYGTNYDGTP